MPRPPAIAAPRRALAGAALAALAACATAPGPAPAPAPLVPPETPGAVIELSLKGFGMWGGRAPSEVWFARVAALNGSDCTPRPHEFDPALDRTTDLGGADLGGIALAGSVEGAGAVAGDPTCMYDEAFTPVWGPLLYRANRIEGTRAYLDAPPPARYVAVAATFVTNPDNDSTDTLYLSADLIARTEVALPPGARRHMGRYVLSNGSFHLDQAQERFKAQIAPLGPGWGSVLAENIMAALAGGSGRSVEHRAADVQGAVYPEEAPAAAPVYPW